MQFLMRSLWLARFVESCSPSSHDPGAKSLPPLRPLDALLSEEPLRRRQVLRGVAGGLDRLDLHAV